MRDELKDKVYLINAVLSTQLIFKHITLINEAFNIDTDL